jgi:peroxiredoxin 2/4
MKPKTLFFLLGVLLVTNAAWSQTTRSQIPLIGDPAPAFTAESTTGTINFPADFGNQWKILLSHPADFTPVCSSEILEFAYAQKEFSKLHTQLVFVSTDDLDSHRSWLKSLESLNYLGRDPVKVDFPIVDDHTKAIANEYGMIHPGSGSTKDVRGVFIISPSDVVRALFFYPSTTGRNIEEIKRTLIALQTADKETVLTPANWQQGKDVLVPYLKSGDEAVNLKNPDYYKVAWYMWFKKEK